MKNDINELLRAGFSEIVTARGLGNGKVTITTKVLTPEEAIGNPLERDYALIKGRERLVQARYDGALGVAFSDMYGNHEDDLVNIIDMDLFNNFRRAVFISMINAVLGKIGLVEKTSHCKDDGLIRCRDSLEDYIVREYGSPRIFMAGFQPRFAEVLTKKFDTIVCDMDSENIGKKVNGVTVRSGEEWERLVEGRDLLFVTGSSFVNDTAKNFIIEGTKTVFYGVTCAGPCYLLDLPRYCPEGA